VGRFGFDVSGASHLGELHALLRGSLLIRRKKEDVLSQLPDKQRQVIWVETKPSIKLDVGKQMANLRRLKATSADSDDAAAALRNKVRTAQNELYMSTGLAKVDAVKEFCKDTTEMGCKYIVFVHHVAVMDELDAYVTAKLKLKRIRIDGQTPQSSRQELCRDFQENPDCRVALLSITAAGLGLTLTQATVVIFAELYWNPGSLLQAEDRAHRIGQRDCVLVKYLLAKQTLDESMWSTIGKKLSVVGQSLTGTGAHMELMNNGDSADAAADMEPVENNASRNEPAANLITSFFRPKAVLKDVAPVGRHQGNEDVILIEDEKELSGSKGDVIEIADDPVMPSYRSNGASRKYQDGLALPLSRTLPEAQDIIIISEDERSRDAGVRIIVISEDERSRDAVAKKI